MNLGPYFGERFADGSQKGSVNWVFHTQSSSPGKRVDGRLAIVLTDFEKGR
jgi:hypothetical protein